MILEKRVTIGMKNKRDTAGASQKSNDPLQLKINAARARLDTLIEAASRKNQRQNVINHRQPSSFSSLAARPRLKDQKTKGGLLALSQRYSFQRHEWPLQQLLNAVEKGHATVLGTAYPYEGVVFSGRCNLRQILNQNHYFMNSFLVHVTKDAGRIAAADPRKVFTNMDDKRNTVTISEYIGRQLMQAGGKVSVQDRNLGRY